jgi:hypothetical protein
MLRIIVMTGIMAVLAAPFCACAGWNELMNSVEQADRIIGNRPAPPVTEAVDEPPQLREPRGEAPRGNADSHFIQSDDYFISTRELGRDTYIYVDLAKVVTAPSPATKHEGEFMKVRDGQNLWTNHIWQSRIASKNELKLGMHIIAFNDNNQHEVYQAPHKKDSARGGAWFYAKITDLSDMYKGFVTVSGNYKVGLNNIRIPLR